MNSGELASNHLSSESTTESSEQSKGSKKRGKKPSIPGPESRRPLRKRPRKEETVEEFQSLITKYNRLLTNCGVPPKHILAWGKEPWTYVNIRKSLKWWRSYLQPELDNFIYFMNRNTPQGWKRLQMLNASHEDLKLLGVRRRRVVEFWHKRPRFPYDKDRSEGGY